MDIFWTALGILSLIAGILFIVLLPFLWSLIPGLGFLYLGFRSLEIAQDMYQ